MQKRKKGKEKEKEKEMREWESAEQFINHVLWIC